MTTATTAGYRPTTTATVPITLRAVDPIHQGAGTAGNTSLLRMQDSVDPDGNRNRTPFVSGASLRHTIRDALAWLTVDTIGLPDGGLGKLGVDTLWSGGALTATGAQTDLRAMSARHDLLPSLSLMGYSMGSDIVRGALVVTNAHLACEENRWRLPPKVAAMPAAQLRAAAWRDEEFGTRHDVAGGPTDRLVDAVDAAVHGTTQMIYDVQVVRAGSVWYCEVGVDTAVPGEVDALAAALTQITKQGQWPLGAKRGQGFARCQVIAADTSALTPDLDAAAARHVDHLTGHADAIRALLAGIR